ncbi:MAG: hypothetical protein U5K36_02955 [Roseovarius sp.]|nr:hypothetical protein [Roseovarius sp.]
MFALVILREIVAGRNWRNLIVPGMLGVFVIGNGPLHVVSGLGWIAAFAVI